MHPKPIPSVWLNGTFDVLHTGHIKLFRYARFLVGNSGSVYVGIDTDERVRSKKGPTRPINTLKDRILMLRSIRYVDVVSPFATDEQLVSLIDKIKPKYMLIGDDYRGRPIIGSQHIENIIYITRDGKSTSDIVNR